jgi:hypothetical protein
VLGHGREIISLDRHHVRVDQLALPVILEAQLRLVRDEDVVGSFFMSLGEWEGLLLDVGIARLTLEHPLNDPIVRRSDVSRDLDTAFGELHLTAKRSGRCDTSRPPGQELAKAVLDPKDLPLPAEALPRISIEG